MSKHARNADPETSHESAEKVKTQQLEAEVLAEIKTFGRDGCIMDEVAKRFINHRRHTIAPRGAALKDRGEVVVIGKRASVVTGCKQEVLVATCHLDDWEKEYYFKPRNPSGKDMRRCLLRVMKAYDSDDDEALEDAILEARRLTF